jgi:hypothetical protein
MLWLLAAGCNREDLTLPVIGRQPAVEPTPMGDMLTFVIPDFRVTVPAGETIPGTFLTLHAKQGEIYRVSIEGQQTEKRSGDSFNWQGVMAPATHGVFNLKLLPNASADSLTAGGNVVLTVFSPQPAESSIAPQRPQAPIVFAPVPVDEIVPPGRQIPGTSLLFESAEGNRVTFSGGSTYPVYQIGDSLVWRGLLRDNIYADYVLRIERLEQYGLRVRGTVTLTIFQANLPGN